MVCVLRVSMTIFIATIDILLDDTTPEYKRPRRGCSMTNFIVTVQQLQLDIWIGACKDLKWIASCNHHKWPVSRKLQAPAGVTSGVPAR